MATQLMFAPNELNPEVRRLPLEYYAGLPVDPLWTKEETIRLVEQVNSNGPRWPTIAIILGKTPEQCLGRYVMLIKSIPSESAAAMASMRSSAGAAEHAPFKTESPSPAASPSPTAGSGPGASSPTAGGAASTQPPVKKRNRRPANQIQRLYKCDIPGCNKSYGTEGSLRTHAMLKHNSANLPGVARARRNSLPTPGQAPAFNTTRRKSIHDVLLQQQAAQGGRPGSTPSSLHNSDSLLHASGSFGSPPASPFSPSSPYPDSPESYLSDSSQQSDGDYLQVPTGQRRHSIALGQSGSGNSPPPPAAAGPAAPISGAAEESPSLAYNSNSRRFSMPPVMPSSQTLGGPLASTLGNPLSLPTTGGPLGTHSIGIAPSPQTFVPIDLKSLKFSNNHLIVNNSPHQLKYSQLPIVMLSIGSWHRTTSGKCGDLLARFSFYESKFTWEIQSSYDTTMNRIDVSFEDVAGLGIESLDDGTAIFTVETNRPPQFFTAVPESHGALMWSPTKDFTGGEASNFRRHIVHFFSGALNAPLEFLLGTNPRMSQLAKQGLSPDSPLLFSNVGMPPTRLSLSGGGDPFFRGQGPVDAGAAGMHQSSPKLSLAAVQRGMFNAIPGGYGGNGPVATGSDFSINSLVSSGHAGGGGGDQSDDGTSWITTEIPKISMEDTKIEMSAHLAAQHQMHTKACGHAVDTHCDCDWNFLEPLGDMHHGGNPNMGLGGIGEEDFISSVLQ